MFSYFLWGQVRILKSGVSVHEGGRPLCVLQDKALILGIRPKQLCKKLGKWKSERWIGAWEKSLGRVTAGVEPWREQLEKPVDGCASGGEVAVG